MAILAICGGKKTKTKAFPTWPQWNDEDEKALIEALHSGRWARNNQKISNQGGYIEKLEERVAQIHNAKYALAVTSGTAALDIAVRAIELREGDEVIVTPYTFIASATCILNSGGVPVMADIDYETWNIDVEKLEQYITSRTKAIIVVHFGGQPTNMERLMEISKKNHLKVIEDVAHAFGARWNNKPVGTIGDIGCFSMQSSKNLTCGEGGIILTNNEDMYKKIYSLHMCGRNYNGAWYQYEYLGWNYRITEFQAAVAYSQLLRLKDMDDIRRKNAEYLTQKLNEIKGIKVVKTDSRVTNRVYHLFTFRYDSKGFNGLSRKRFIMAMNAEGIPCHEGYIHPIYKNNLFLKCKKVNYTDTYCEEAEKLCKEAIWLHQEILLGDKKDMDEIVEAIKKIKTNIKEIKR